MSFLYPLGLLGLIGIPILILIYIIKSKYAEQTVSTTYLWTLSERFLKRKRPISPLAGIISLILQAVSVALISLIVAHPIITVPNSANEYCFILDASGSMNTERDGSSRFERAKGEIEDIIDSSTDGSRYSLIWVGDVTATVFEGTESKKDAKKYLSELECGYTEADYTSALGTAQEYFDTNSSVITYLVTDTEYASSENIRVINVSGTESNAAISDVTWDISGGTLTVTGRVSVYTDARELTVFAYADGGDTPIAKTDLSIEGNTSELFTLTAALKTFSSLRLTISGEDALACDDEYMLYDVKSEDSYSILIVSDTPFFLETVFRATGRGKITVMSPEEYNSSVSGYGLYVFESCTPSAPPDDGAVWFLDPQGSIPDTGFSVQGDVMLSRGEKIEMTSSSSTVAKSMTSGLRGEDIEIIEYVRCSLYRNFTTLFSYQGNPLVFAGVGSSGHREVVFAFDIHNSNLPLLVDFVVLVDNLMRFSFPDVIEHTDYSVGEEASVNVIANCESIRVDSPRGTVTYLNTDAAVTSFMLSEAGTYTVTVTVSRIPTTFYIYASLPDSESDPLPSAESIALIGEGTEGGFDGTFDPIYILFVLLAVLFLADWMVYCYEKYQLR